MATDDQATPQASAEDWLALESACSSSAFARCLIDLRDCFLDELPPRVAALEAAMEAVEQRGEIPSVAGNSDHAPAQPPAPAHGGEGGLTVEQLAECLPGNAWQNSPEGYSRQAFARHLLAHPITGPRLRAAPAGASSVITRSVITAVNATAYPPGKVIMTTPTPAAATDGGVTEEVEMSPTESEISKEFLAHYRKDLNSYDLVAFTRAMLAKWGNRRAPTAAPAGGVTEAGGGAGSAAGRGGSLMDWKDTTSYRQGDKERIPTTYEKRTDFLLVVVTRSNHGDRGAWYLRSNLPGLGMVEVGKGDDPAPAQRQALKLIENRLAELANDLEEMKDD